MIARPLNQVKLGITMIRTSTPRARAAVSSTSRAACSKGHDKHLAGVLAHELAHDDLNHVAKAQTLNTGLNIGMIILDQIIPAAARSRRSPRLISRKYSRNEEYAADRHGVTISSGLACPGDDGRDASVAAADGRREQRWFLRDHPGTLERIEALKNGR